MTKAIAPMLAMIACCVGANLLMKVGSQDAPSPLLLGVFSWRTLLGLATFGLGGLFYAAALRFLPLNLAQSYAAAQFVAVILASKLVLGEPVPLTRWFGISMIMVGILIVASYEIR
jgi:undecaprenyl phosphate-alpha-L-ara4N flippase subunit ArnE